MVANNATEPLSRWRRYSAILALIPLFTTAAGCASRNVYVPPPAPEVTVSLPTQRPVTVYLYFTGTTQASKAVEIRSQVQGYLESIHFNDGDNVKEGDLLFVIDPRLYSAKRDEAKADLASMKAQAVRAEAIYNRAVSLLPSNAVAQEEVETKKGDWQVALASVAQAEAKLKEAQLNVDYTHITAPISGRTSRRLVDIGNLVQPNSTLLTTIAQYDPMYVYFTASELEHLEYMKRQRQQASSSASSTPPKVPVEIRLADEEGYPHKGIIDFADNTVDPGTGTLAIRGTFNNPAPFQLSPGLFARVRVPISTEENALLVPERALGEDQAGQFLLVVDQNNKVEHRSVTVGTKADSMRVIEKGLKPNERVIVEGLQRARPGSVVQPVQQ